MMIMFGEWAPDRSTIDPTVANVATNVIPRVASYAPQPSLAPFTNALPGKPLGAAITNTTTGLYRMYAGTGTKLYKLNTATLNWDDVSRTVGGAYTTVVGERWCFAQYGDMLVATNGFDNPQYIDLVSGTNFADLTTAAKGKFCGVLGDFLVLLNDSSLGGNVAQMTWSGLNLPFNWTPRKDSSDFQVFPDGGALMGMVPSAQGAVIFQENCIRQAQLALDTSLIMTFNKTVEGHGAMAPRAIVGTGSGIFYLSQDGFYRYGDPPTPIGAQKVDAFFQSLVSPIQAYTVSGVEDPSKKLIYWLFQDNSLINHEYSKFILVYAYDVNKWSLINTSQGVTEIFSAVTLGYTLDGLDALGINLDALPYSLDSRVWEGGYPVFAGFDEQYRMGFFSGPNYAGQITTTAVEHNPGQRSVCTGFRPMIDAPTTMGAVSVRDYAGGAETVKATWPSNRTGLVPARSSGRYTRYNVTIPAGASWTHAHGVDVNVTTEGMQ